MGIRRVFFCILLIGFGLPISSQKPGEGFLARLETQKAWGQDSLDIPAIRALLSPNSLLEYASSIQQDIMVVFKQLETGEDRVGQVWWGVLRRSTMKKKKASWVWVWKSPTYGKNYEDLSIRSLNQNGLIEILLFTTSGAHRTYLDGVQFDGKTYKTLTGDYFTHLKYKNPLCLTEFATADEGVWLEDLDKDGNMEILLANRYVGRGYVLNVYKWEEDHYILAERKQISEEQLSALIQNEISILEGKGFFP